MTTEKEIISKLLNLSETINSKINNTITELLRIGYETERGKEIVKTLAESLQYTIDETNLN